MTQKAITDLCHQYGIYEITSAFGGSLRVTVDAIDIANLGERKAVAYAAWSELWRNERDQFGNETKRQSGTARMLRAMCDKQGMNVVKSAFTRGIEFSKV